MPALQSPQPESRRTDTRTNTQTEPGTDTASLPLGRALLWPAAAVGIGMLLLYNSFEPPADAKSLARPAVVASASAPASASAKTGASPSPELALALSRSAPKRISILEIAVNAPFVPLDIGPSGQLDAPPPNDNNLVGWFKGGAAPGERGTSIVAGHVDTKTGPAVFMQLRMVKPGSTVDITREDGIIATFKVDSVEVFSKADFPNKRVYADTTTPQLRLITCGGVYDRKAKDYKDNVVVFAHLDSIKQS